jgi:hypothetical protein
VCFIAFFGSYIGRQLTYLPKKYHQYVVPGVRRVYLDTSGEAALQKELTNAECKIKKLVAEQETLLKQCEKHMSAARAHAEGEGMERQRANKLQRDFDAFSSQADADRVASDQYIEDIKDDREEWKVKYQNLNTRYLDLIEQ